MGEHSINKAKIGPYTVYRERGWVRITAATMVRMMKNNGYDMLPYMSRGKGHDTDEVPRIVMIEGVRCVVSWHKYQGKWVGVLRWANNLGLPPKSTPPTAPSGRFA